MSRERLTLPSGCNIWSYFNVAECVADEYFLKWLYFHHKICGNTYCGDKLGKHDEGLFLPLSVLFFFVIPEICRQYFIYAIVSVEHLFDEASNYMLHAQEFIILRWREMHLRQLR